MKRALLLLLSACGLPHVAPHPFTAPAPVTTPIQLCWLETGGLTSPARYGAAGSVQADHWEVTTSALLIRHPRGDVLIDSGLSPTPSDDAKELTAWGRFIFSQTAARNQPRGVLTELLALAGVTAPMGVILSHAHADHAGGLSTLPGVTVWLAKEEADFLNTPTNAVMPAHARAVMGRATPIVFADRGYEHFPTSWDVFDDGTVVVVPTFGHTPGSVATFVNLGARRLVHVGDLINLQESIEREVPKSMLMRSLTDEDPAETDRQVAGLVRLQKEDPTLWILPAHDRDAYEAFFGAMPVESRAPKCVTQ